MAELYASGHLVDFIILIVAAEAVAIGLHWRMTGRGIAPRHLLPNLVAGVCLLLALRLTLAGFEWPAVCGALACAGLASAIDIATRWRS